MVFEAELHLGTCREVPNRPWKIKNWKWPNCCQIFANCSSAELLPKTWHQRQAASLVQHFSQSLHSSCCKTFEEFELAIKELIYKHLIAEPWHLRSWFLNWVKGKKIFRVEWKCRWIDKKVDSEMLIKRCTKCQPGLPINLLKENWEQLELTCVSIMEPAEEAQKQRVPDISQTGKNKCQMWLQLDNILHLICSQDKKRNLCSKIYASMIQTRFNSFLSHHYMYHLKAECKPSPTCPAVEEEEEAP